MLTVTTTSHGAFGQLRIAAGRAGSTTSRCQPRGSSSVPLSVTLTSRQSDPESKCRGGEANRETGDDVEGRLHHGTRLAECDRLPHPGRERGEPCAEATSN